MLPLGSCGGWLPTLGGTHGFATGSNNLDQIVGWAENTVRDSSCVVP
jgi:hypothetical protein